MKLVLKPDDKWLILTASIFILFLYVVVRIILYYIDRHSLV
jgi:hypothetical protein